MKANNKVRPELQPRGHQINWNQVYYFSQVATFGSIKEAAIRLELSPSTLSEHISQLEKDLNVQLFYRHHRRLELSPEGTRLYLRAKEMFEAGQRLVDVLSPIPLGSYPISVGFVPNPALQMAYGIIADFQEAYGPLGMKLFQAGYADVEEKLVGAEFDFAFSDRLPEKKNIQHQLVLASSVRFYVGEKWAGSRFSELLEKLPLLICNAEPSNRSLAEQALQDADLSPSAVITSAFPSALIDLCQRGLGIGVFSDDPKTGTESLRALRVSKDAPKLRCDLYALWAKDAENTAAVKNLIRVLSSQRERC